MISLHRGIEDARPKWIWFSRLCLRSPLTVAEKMVNAIIACTAGSKSSERTHADLTDLAISWFANFLWICKSLLWWSLCIENEGISRI
jgi:hypothetical protein